MPKIKPVVARTAEELGIEAALLQMVGGCVRCMERSLTLRAALDK